MLAPLGPKAQALSRHKQPYAHRFEKVSENTIPARGHEPVVERSAGRRSAHVAAAGLVPARVGRCPRVAGVSSDTIIALLVIALPALVVWTWALVDVVRNPGLARGARVAWIVAVLVLPGVGALLYVAVPGRRRLSAH